MGSFFCLFLREAKKFGLKNLRLLMSASSFFFDLNHTQTNFIKDKFAPSDRVNNLLSVNSICP